MFKPWEYKSLENHVTFYFVNKLDLESVSPGCQLLSFVDHCDSGLKVHLWESVQETWIPLLSRKGIELSPLNLDLKKMEVFPSWDTCTTWKRSLALRFCRLHQLSSNVPERWKYSDGRGFFFFFKRSFSKMFNLFWVSFLIRKIGVHTTWPAEHNQFCYNYVETIYLFWTH